MCEDRRDPEESEEQETPEPTTPEGRGGRPQERVERAVSPPPENR